MRRPTRPTRTYTPFPHTTRFRSARVQPEPEKPQSLLSQPQVETMRHVYEQKNSKQIARLMDVSPHTVDERVRKVLKKLNVANRIEAAQFLADNGAFDYAIPQPPLRYQLANLANATPTAEGRPNGARGIFDIGAPLDRKSTRLNSSH